MPFLRQARDKRGYETTFVMHSYRPGPGQAAGRTRLLYLFRTPSNRKVGRDLLDPEVMAALEHTHPDLTFDWHGMLRVPAQMAAEPDRDRDRGGRQRQDRPEKAQRRDRNAPAGGRGRPERAAAAGPAPSRRDAPPAETAVVEAPLAILEDDSLLGRTAGAMEAARMRASYNELVQRIARRARTPEDRDRLIEQAGRLNPDEWPDADTVTTSVATFAVDCEAIRQELPRRRRGRRGGRTRERESGGSAIIEQDAHELEMVGETGADERVLDGGVGAGDTGAADPAGDPIHDID